MRPPEWAHGYYYVWIVDTDNPRPVFHCLRRFSGLEPPYLARMRCGATDMNRRGLTARLRVDHALQIARPCRVCFPAAQEALDGA